MDTDYLIDFVTALWLGVIGACLGSFLNVVAYRLPRGMSVVWKPSHCPQCNHPIRARDNVPVFGWLWLRGKCRDCGVRISPRYAIVEAATGFLFFALAYVDLLRGSPWTEFTGALDVVWNPQWLALGAYVYHCLLVSIFIVILLLKLDKTISGKRFILMTLVILVLWLLAWYVSSVN